MAIAMLLPAEAQAELPPGCDALGVKLVEHSCFHATFGPYAQVVAAPASASAAAPSVDPVHTFHEVRLPTPLGENVVSYRVASANRAGEWAIFRDPAVPLRVESERTGALSPILEHADTGCASLPSASVFSLADEPYRIVLGPSPVDRTFLVIENVSDFVTNNGWDADGDGHGDAEQVVVTMCVPPPGFVANNQDCDDTNAAVHPGAVERCDGVDQNCNLVPDDIGLPCDSGFGACQSEGTFQCSEAGRLATCDATPGQAEAEACDGRDGDCDGVSDLDEAELCGGADTPVCVLVLGETRCGCAEDAQCGGASSGRICDGESRTCLDGCVAVAGRNGCPEGEACTSGDPAAPGVCRRVGACSTAAECPPGEVCAADGSCVEPAGAPPPAGGCACSTAGPRGGVPWWTGALLLVPLVRRRRVRRVAAALGLSTALLGCSGRVVIEEVDEPVEPSEPCTRRLSEELIQHACSHLAHGPFADVAAAPSPSSSADVSNIHETFRVSFAAVGAAGQGHLEYTPSRPGEHVVFSSVPVRIDVALADGGAPSPALHEEEDEFCQEARYAVVFPLQQQARHDMTVESTTSTLLLFIEQLDAFSNPWRACSRR